MNQENNPQTNDIEQGSCCYQETSRAPQCEGPLLYLDICGEDYCSLHAVWAMEGDAKHIEEELAVVLEGVRQLSTRGLPLPPVTARLLSRLSLGSTEQPPIIQQELGAAE